MKWLIDQSRTFLHLAPCEQFLLLQAWVLFLLLELALRGMSFQRLLTVFRRAVTKRRGRPNREPAVARLAWLVDVAGRYSPVHTTCLKQAMVLSWLLGQRGILTTLRIGVARREGSLAAHAWLERQGRVICDPAGYERYEPLPPITCGES